MYHCQNTSQEAPSQAAGYEQASKADAPRRAIADTDVRSRCLIRDLELAGDIDQELIRGIK